MSNTNPIPNLQDFLRHQDSYANKSIIAIAGTSTNPNPPPPPPTPPTIAFNVLKPKRKKQDPIRLPTTSTAVIPPCTECGKRFSSWKALFGHMRCHPERQWRGINPPPHFRRGSNLAAWAQFTGEEHEVASSLVLLANGPPKEEGGPSRHRLHGQKRRWEEAAVECEHTCSVCLRGFSSGQALGGHMRCHWDKVEDSALTASSSGSRDFMLDLNLPPPVAVERNNEGSVAADVLDLRLGI